MLAEGIYTDLPVVSPVSARNPGRCEPRRPWLALVTLAILYGSFIPFDLDLTALQEIGVRGLSQTPVAGGNREDVATNLVLYVPVGICAMLCGYRRSWPSILCLLFSVGYGLALSLGVETLQNASTIRVASWLDVGCNLAGVAGGALSVLALRQRVREAWRLLGIAMRLRPFSTISICLALGLLAFNLMPFDFVTRSAALHDSFRQAEWDVATPFWSIEQGRPLEAIVGQVRGAGWFALLGFVVALAHREARQDHRMAFNLAALHSVALVIVIELLELFTVTQRFSFGVIVIRCLGATMGIWVALYLVDSSIQSGRLGRSRQAVSTMLLFSVGMLQLLLILLAAVDFPAQAALSSGGLPIARLPFEALWHGSMVRAAQVVLALICIYGSLAFTFGEVLIRIDWPRPWHTVAGLSVLVAMGFELLKTATSAHAFDLTTPILAVLTVALTARLHASLHGWVRQEAEPPDSVPIDSAAPASAEPFAEYSLRG